LGPGTWRTRRGRYQFDHLARIDRQRRTCL